MSLATVQGVINLIANARGAIKAVSEGVDELRQSFALNKDDIDQETLDRMLNELKSDLDSVHARVQTKLRG
ncbi:hypothetical protein VJI72_07775, partial [Parvimonas micra]|uniref:hypothetical protein n=1 Tax=Parvimonas micra TaxID=33033 RepID=UPI002B4A561A